MRARSRTEWIEFIGCFAPIVLLIAGIMFANASPSACPDCVVRNSDQAMAIAHHELEKNDPPLEHEPGYWTSDLNGADWKVTKRLYGGGAAEYKIDAHSGKIVEMRIYMGM